MTAPALRVIGALHTTRPTNDPARALLRGAVLIIETAANDNIPVAIYTDAHAVQLTLDNEDAFNTWATWLQAAVDPYRIDKQTVFYSARATMLGVPVVIQWTDLDEGWGA
jgi:hypothetical protein